MSTNPNDIQVMVAKAYAEQRAKDASKADTWTGDGVTAAAWNRVPDGISFCRYDMTHSDGRVAPTIAIRSEGRLCLLELPESGFIMRHDIISGADVRTATKETTANLMQTLGVMSNVGGGSGGGSGGGGRDVDLTPYLEFDDPDNPNPKKFKITQEGYNIIYNAWHNHEDNVYRLDVGSDFVFVAKVSKTDGFGESTFWMDGSFFGVLATYLVTDNFDVKLVNPIDLTSSIEMRVEESGPVAVLDGTALQQIVNDFQFGNNRVYIVNSLLLGQEESYDMFFKPVGYDSYAKCLRIDAYMGLSWYDNAVIHAKINDNGYITYTFENAQISDFSVENDTLTSIRLNNRTLKVGGGGAEFPVLDFTEFHSDWTYYRITSTDPETNAPVFEEMGWNSHFGIQFAMEPNTQVAVKVPVEFATQFKSCGMMKVIAAKDPSTGTIVLNYTEQLYQGVDEYNIFGTIYTSCPGLSQMGETKILYVTVAQNGEAYISNTMLLIS